MPVENKILKEYRNLKIVETPLPTGFDDYKGEGDFIGSFLENVPDEVVRKDAMKVYDDIIKNYELKTGKLAMFYGKKQWRVWQGGLRILMNL